MKRPRGPKSSYQRKAAKQQLRAYAKKVGGGQARPPFKPKQRRK